MAKTQTQKAEAARKRAKRVGERIRCAMLDHGFCRMPAWEHNADQPFAFMAGRVTVTLALARHATTGAYTGSLCLHMQARGVYRQKVAEPKGGFAVAWVAGQIADYAETARTVGC